MNTICTECGGHYEEWIMPEHLEDVGGIEARLLNTVRVRRCANCNDEMRMIPDMRGLVRAVAMARALVPIRLSGGDLKLMRRALDMSQKDFAKAMDVAPETMSRWEAGAKGVGGFSEKLVRHNVCALLSDDVPAIEYDAASIARMVVRDLPSGEKLPPITVEYALVKQDGERSRAWDAQPSCRAA